MATTTDSPAAPQGLDIADAVVADHQAFWGRFTRFVTFATIAVVVLLILMAYFLT